MLLSKEFYKAAADLVKLYPKPRHALLPLLFMVQDEVGYLSSEAMKELAFYLQAPVNDIVGVATFYSMFKLNPRGKNYIGVCTNLSCWLNGGVELYQEFKKYLSQSKNETLKELVFLEETECLGACGSAPVAQCNRVYLNNATIDSLKQWLKSQNVEV